jgi:alkylation response protein AidB-like acyl-CoA dehydrogenase
MPEATTIGAPVGYGSPQLTELVAQVAAGVIERDEQGRPPFEELALLKEARIGALRLTGEQGGAGATVRELFATVIDLGEADPNVAHSLRNHYQFVESLIRRPNESNEVWFEHVRAGRLFGLAATELSTPRAGSRPAAPATAVSRTPTGLRLDGEKFYSTGNLYADLLVVTASDLDGELTRLAVPVDRPGVEIPNDWDGIGQRFTGSGTTRFTATPVEESDVIHGGWYGDTPYLATFPQLYLTAVIAGILRRVASDAARIVATKERTFYHSASDTPTRDPILQLTVGELSSVAFVAEASVLTAAEALQEATDAHGGADEHELAVRASLKAAKAKVVVDELALRAAGELFDVGGGQGVRRSNHLDRHWRNIRTLAAHNPRTFKARAIGAYEIDGTPLPNAAFF